jgi:SAM-dependent methyltransferase
MGDVMTVASTTVTGLKPTSLTHQHILTAIRSELPTGGVRVLDVGCGDGGLAGFLQSHLAGAQVFGFDVTDIDSMHRPDFPDSTVRRLLGAVPDVPWQDRIRGIPVGDAWPYPDASFDAAVSNQVLEHVTDLDAFLAELGRVLAPGGRSVHVFPVRSTLFDGHVRMPLVHRIAGLEQRTALVRMWSRLGIGTRTPAEDIAGYADRASGYLHLATVYRPLREFVVASSRAGLLLSYRYTRELYGLKLASVLGRRLPQTYRTRRRAMPDWAAFCALRHLSSITLVLEKPS